MLRSPLALSLAHPLAAALWSASLSDVLSFPVEQLCLFLLNHKMLQIFDRPKWLTIGGRSATYVRSLHQALISNEVTVHTSTEVTKVRPADGEGELWEVISNARSLGTFDQVVFACPPSLAAKMLSSSCVDAETKQVLEAVKYEQVSPEKANNQCFNIMSHALTPSLSSQNSVILHSDPALMPSRRSAWASWNCLGVTDLLVNGLCFNDNEGPRMKSSFVTYWLNKLQSLKTSANFFVSLNPRNPPDPKTVHGVFNLSHPQFTRSTLAATAKIRILNRANNNLFFCGAWMGFGFHEDGLRSGLEVANLISPSSDEGTIQPLKPPDLYVPPKPSALSFLITTLPIRLCKYLVNRFLIKSIVKGKLILDLPDGSTIEVRKGFNS